MPRFQVGIDVAINDREVQQFIANMRAQLNQIRTTTLSGAPRVSSTGAESRLAGFQAQQEAAIHRQVRAGTLGGVQAKAAVDQVRAMVEETRLAMEAEFKRPIKPIDPAAVRSRVRESLRAGGRLDADGPIYTEAEKNSRAATRAARKAGVVPNTEGGVPEVKGLKNLPDMDEVKRVEVLLREGGTHLAQVLEDIARSLAASRMMGLEAGNAGEDWFAMSDATTPDGQPRMLDRRTDLTEKRRRRELLEEREFELRMQAERDLIESTVELAALRRKTSAMESTLRQNYGVDDDVTIRRNRRETQRQINERDLGIIPPNGATDVQRDAEINVRQRLLRAQQTDAEAYADDARSLEVLTFHNRETAREAAVRQAQRRNMSAGSVDTEVSKRREDAEFSRKVLEKEYQLAGHGTDLERDAAIAAARGLRTLALKTTRAATATDSEVQAVLAGEKAQRQFNTQLAKARDAEAAANGQRPGVLQQLEHRFRGGYEKGQAVSEQRSIGSVVGGSLLTTARFAASGALLYGAINTVGTLTKELEQLQIQLVDVQNTLEATDRAGEFPQFRAAILSIARETGTSADEVANVGKQMLGAFQDTGRAIEETKQAFRISDVTGLSQTELTDSLTAVVKSYDTTTEHIGDRALALQDRTGVLAAETLKVFGDLGSTAAEAGLDLEHLGAIAAVVQQRSGRAGSAIAEGLGRVIPAIQESALEIARMYRSNAALAPNSAKVEDAFRQGKPGAVLQTLIEDYNKLDTAQQRYLKNMLGGRREAQLLDPLFAGSSDIQELSGNLDEAGTLSERFAARQRTLTETLQRLKETLLQIGEGLANLGLFQTFTLFAHGALRVTQVLQLLIGFLEKLNDSLGGIPGELIKMGLGLMAVYKAAKLLQEMRLGNGVLSLLLGGGTTGGGGLAGLLLRGRSTLGVGTALPAGTDIGAAFGGAGAAEGGLMARLLGGAKNTGTGMLEMAGQLGGRGMFGTQAMEYGYGAATLPTAALGAATLGVGIATTIAVSKAMDEWNKLDKRQAADAQVDKETFEKESLRQLESNRDLYGHAKSSLWHNFTSFDSEGFAAMFSGEQTGGERNDAAIGEARIKEFRAAAEEGYFKFSEGELDKFIDMLRKQKGQGVLGERAKAMLDALSEKQRSKIEEIVGEAKQRKDDIEAGGANQQQKIADITAAFQAGEINYAAYIQGLDQQIDILHNIDGDKDMHQQWLDAVRQRNAALGQAAVNAAQFAVQMRQVEGQAPDAGIPDLKEALNNPHISPEQTQQLASQIQQLQRQAFDNSIQNASSAAEAYETAQAGTELDPETKQKFLDWQKKTWGRIVYTPGRIHATKEQLDQLRQRAFQESMLQARADAGVPTNTVDQAAQALDQARAELWDATAHKDDAGGIGRLLQAQIGYNEALDRFGSSTFDDAQSVRRSLSGLIRDPSRRAAAEMDIASRDMARAKSRGDDAGYQQASAAFEQARRSYLDDVTSQAEAAADLAVAKAGDDPVAAAYAALADAARKLDLARRNGLGGAAIDQALAAKERAEQNMADAQRAEADAAGQLWVAASGTDPVEAAREQVRAANRAVAGAHNTTEALNAQRAVVEAQRTLNSALDDIVSSQTDLALAMAEAAGDTIKVAQLQVKNAQEALDRAVRDGAGEAEINRLRASVTSSQANLVTTQRSRRMDDIEWMYESEQITAQQFIEMLQTELAAIPASNHDARREIERRIRGLREEMGKDLQFNLPSELKLPTLYEARRLAQTGGDFGAFQDNRSVSITLNANNAIDGEAAVQKIVDVITAPPRTGNRPRLY